MENLRSLLETLDTDLHRSLETSWGIARSEWIPTLNMDSESYGGLPHLQSVERWMDRIAEACRPFWSRHGETPFGFNAAEVYLALAAALFHDIGRGRPGSDHHGEISRKIIEAHWAQLGIKDGRIAHELALICAFHTEEVKWRHHDVTTIHPWGTVHTEAIASFLTLADELDTAYTRAAPQYMKPPELILRSGETLHPDLLERMDGDYFTKGLYREFIGDVELDPGSHLIKTVLFNDRLPGPLGARNSQEQGCAGKWLEEVHSDKAFTSQFRANDYFFSYLSRLRPHVSGLMHNFMANQYQKAANFKRVTLVRGLQIPKAFPGPGHLVYSLHLWDRQHTTGPQSDSSSLSRKLKPIGRTISLIEDTFKDVDKRLDRVAKRKVMFDGGMGWDGIQRIFSRVEGFLHYVHGRIMVERKERREGPASVEEKLGCLRKNWTDVLGSENTENQKKDALRALREGEEAKTNSRKDLCECLAVPELVLDKAKREKGYKIGGHAALSLEEAHRLLQLLFHALTFVDLLGLTDCKKNSSWEVESFPCEDAHFRARKSWSIEDFHANLLMAFHVYLVNVRMLWKGKEDLDFRYIGRGKAEALIQDLAAANDSGRSEQYRLILDQFSDLLGCCSGVEEDTEGQKKSPQRQEKSPQRSVKPSEALLRDLGTFVKRRKRRKEQQGMASGDFEFAVRFMFMQWLSADLCTKQAQLERIKRGLEKIEVPFTNWFTEYNNHLFDEHWRLRLEPILDRGVMKTLTGHIFRLTKGLHCDQPQVAWETLAAELRDPKLHRVKTATNRLANLMRILGYLPAGCREHLFQHEEKESSEKGAKNIHFGLLLLSELERADRRENGEGGEDAPALETSFSGWQLLLPKGAGVADSTKCMSQEDIESGISRVFEPEEGSPGKAD